MVGARIRTSSCDGSYPHSGYLNDYHICALISRANPAPKLWRDMTPAEKGALLLAAHEGKVIEYRWFEAWREADRPAWSEGIAYRVRPEPVVEVVDLLIPGGVKIGTVELRDGKPDPASVKVEEL